MAEPAYNTSDPTKPTWTRPEVVAADPDLKLIRRLTAGTRPMWEAVADYVRKWEREDTQDWLIRAKSDTLPEQFERVLSASVGMIFATPPVIEWNQSETAFEDIWDDVDAQGTAGPVFAKRFADQGIATGYALILTDHPAVEGEVTAADEAALGLRPRWALYPREAVRNWNTATINGRPTLTRVVLAETGEAPTGEYGTKTVDKVRVLQLVPGETGYQAEWVLFRTERDTVGRETIVEEKRGVFRDRNGATRDTLPLRIGYAGRTDAPLTAKPPLMAVAWANLSYWQKATNLSYYEDRCAFPQDYLKGALLPDPVTGMPPKLLRGPGAVVQTDADGDFRIIELTGSSMEQLRKGLDEKLYRIASSSLSFMMPQTRAAETAEAKRLDATAENSTLATAAQGIEDALNGALEDLAWYLGIPAEGAPVLTLNRDFEQITMDAATMTAYGVLREKVGLPARIVLEALKAGGRIASGTDVEELALEMDAQVAAEQERQAQAAQDQLQLQRERMQAGAPAQRAAA